MPKSPKNNEWDAALLCALLVAALFILIFWQ